MKALKRIRREQEGIALLTTVWAALFLALLATTVSLTTRSETALIRSNADLLKARELAMAAGQLGLNELMRSGTEKRLPRDGMSFRFQLEGGEATVRIQDEMGKMDLNAAPFELIKPLFIAIARESGLDAFDAATIAERLPGRSAAGTGEAPERGAQTQLLQSVPELRSLPGVSEDFYRRLEPYVTVYNREARINPKTASSFVLMNLPGMDRRSAEQLVALRRTGAPRPSFGSAENFLTETEGPVFSITGTGRTRAGIQAEVKLVVVVLAGGLVSAQNSYRIIEMR